MRGIEESPSRRNEFTTWWRRSLRFPCLSGERVKSTAPLYFRSKAYGILCRRRTRLICGEKVKDTPLQ